MGQEEQHQDEGLAGPRGPEPVRAAQGLWSQPQDGCCPMGSAAGSQTPSWDPLPALGDHSAARTPHGLGHKELGQGSLVTRIPRSGIGRQRTLKETSHPSLRPRQALCHSTCIQHMGAEPPSPTASCSGGLNRCGPAGHLLALYNVYNVPHTCL